MDIEHTEWINTGEALEIVKKSSIAKYRYKPNRPTLISWIEKYNLGYKFAGRWQVNKEKLIKFLESGDPDGQKNS